MRAGKICARYQIIIARKDFYRMKFKKSDAKRQELAYTSTKDKFHASCHFRAQTFEFICMRLGPCHTWCLRLSTIKHAKKWGKDEHQIAAQDDDYAEQNMYAAINMACLDWKQTYTSHVSGGCKKITVESENLCSYYTHSSWQGDVDIQAYPHAKRASTFQTRNIPSRTV
jgi:hypothetical protein